MPLHDGATTGGGEQIPIDLELTYQQAASRVYLD
jgi:hypothetical protein